MSPRKDVDWEKVEKSYRLGKLTVREIAADQNITHGAVNKRAKRDGWERDLSAKSKSFLEKEAARERVSLDEAIDEFESSGFVYVIYFDAPDRFYKIGMAKHFVSRFEQHRCSSPFELCVACVFFVKNMRFEEKVLHETFKGKRIRGEWFKLDHDDLQFIAQRSLLVGS